MNRYIQLFRIGNCIMGVVGLLIGVLIATGMSIFNYSPQIAIASLLVFTFIIGGNSLNDYMDREIDKVGHPERPIPSGKLTPRTVLAVSATAFIISLACAVFLDIESILIVVGAIILMLAYELRTKKAGLTGNISIAALTGGLFLLGGAVVGKMDTVIAVAAMAGLATLGREIVKDIQDMKADADRHTLPQRIGAKKAGILATLAFLAAVALSFEPVILGIFGIGYLITVVLADGIFIYSSIVLFRDPKQGQTWAKNGMLVALIAFLVGGLL